MRLRHFRPAVTAEVPVVRGRTAGGPGLGAPCAAHGFDTGPPRSGSNSRKFGSPAFALDPGERCLPACPPKLEGEGGIRREATRRRTVCLSPRGSGWQARAIGITSSAPLNYLKTGSGREFARRHFRQTVGWRRSRDFASAPHLTMPWAVRCSGSTSHSTGRASAVTAGSVLLQLSSRERRGHAEFEPVQIIELKHPCTPRTVCRLTQ
jgi:hypothetical protein